MQLAHRFESVLARVGIHLVRHEMKNPARISGPGANRQFQLTE